MIAAFTGLAGCNNNKSSGDGDAATPPPAPSSLINITPALGRFSAGAVVAAFRTDGTPLVSGTTNADGVASLDMGSHTGPVLIRVSGAPGVTYYDEGSNQQRGFGPADILLAAVDALESARLRGGIGVTPLTHAAASMLVADMTAAAPVVRPDAPTIEDANHRIAFNAGLDQLGELQGLSILTPPQALGDATQQFSGVSGRPMLYGAVLAAMAARAAGSGSNPLDQARALAVDAADGRLDDVNALERALRDDLGAVIRDRTATAPTESTVLADLVRRMSTPVAGVIPDQRLAELREREAQLRQLAGSGDLARAKTLVATLRRQIHTLSNGRDGLLDNEAGQFSREVGRLGAISEDGLQLSWQAFNAAALLNGYGASVPGCSQSSSTVVTCQRFRFTPRFERIVDRLRVELVDEDAGLFRYTMSRDRCDPLGLSCTPLVAAQSGEMRDLTPDVEDLNVPDVLRIVGRTLANGSDAAYADVDMQLSISAIETRLEGTWTERAADGAALISLTLQPGTALKLNLNQVLQTGMLPPGSEFRGLLQATAGSYSLSGDLALVGWRTDRSGQVSLPETTRFTGNLRRANGSAALSASATVAISNLANFDARLADSATNFLGVVASVTGTLTQGSIISELTLELDRAQFGNPVLPRRLSVRQNTIELVDDGSTINTSTGDFTLRMKTSDGLRLVSSGVVSSDAPATLQTAQGGVLGTIRGSLINWVDGTVESLL